MDLFGWFDRRSAPSILDLYTARDPEGIGKKARSMRFLGIGDYNSLGAMYAALIAEEHEVRVHIAQAEAAGIYAGMVPQSASLEEAIAWVEAAGQEGIVIMETANLGTLADDLRLRGFKVVGGSKWTDRLENDRSFGQAVMQEAGMTLAPSREFANLQQAINFVEHEPARYVYKFSGGNFESTRNYVGVMDDAADLLAMLKREQLRVPVDTSILLMDHLQGVEVGIGGYFNGQQFIGPPCIDWEHKRFFNGDLGELTGEMGTVVSYENSQCLAELSLYKFSARLREHSFHGYININMIVNENGIWPLEFTSRFGYPGFAICSALHREDWASILFRMANGLAGDIQTHPGFAVGVVLTVPPFPYEQGYADLSRGMPIFLQSAATEGDIENIHWGEVGIQEAQLVTAGSIGYIAVCTGIGNDIAAARSAAYGVAQKVLVPNLRYRTDIGSMVEEEGIPRLKRLGLMTG